MSSLLSEKEREEFLFKRAHENLYAEVARVYYDVLKAEADLANIRTNIQLTQDRIGELKERERLGKSRRSELLSSQSQFESLRSLEADALGAIAHDREALSFLTGKDMSTVELVDELNPNEALVPLDNALARADNRLDIQAFKADEDAKRKAIYVARAGYSPTADVTAHYYTQRPGLLQDVDWDVIFNVDVPIFQGGGVHSASVEAVSRHREAELNLTRLRRSVQSEVRNALTDLKTSLEQAERLESAYDKAHESYQLHVKEYRLGLVNNLEVLASQNAMQATRHDRDQAVLDSRVHAVNFKLAVGDSE
jgi:outer membrane protein